MNNHNENENEKDNIDLVIDFSQSSEIYNSHDHCDLVIPIQEDDQCKKESIGMSIPCHKKIPFISKCTKEEANLDKNSENNCFIQATESQSESRIKKLQQKGNIDEIDQIIQKINHPLKGHNKNLKSKVVIKSMGDNTNLDFEENENNCQVNINSIFHTASHNDQSNEEKQNHITCTSGNTIITNAKPSSKKKSWTIIDLALVNELETISNADLLLSILEITSNAKSYGIFYSNKAKIFWNDVTQRAEFKNIFQNFRPETLKKYWIMLSDLKPADLAETIKKYSQLINQKKLKLLTLISHLADFCKGKIKDFEESINFILNNNSTMCPKYLSRKTERIEDDSCKEKHIQTEVQDVSYNKKKDEDEPLILDEEALNTLLKEKIENEDQKPTSTSDEKLTTAIAGNVNLNLNLNLPKKMRTWYMSENDKAMYESIDEMIEILNIQFPKYTKAEILHILKSNSFNITNTYLFLSDPSKFNYLTFSDVDDYVIKNMRSTEHYDELINEKGRNVVNERLKFLNIED